MSSSIGDKNMGTDLISTHNRIYYLLGEFRRFLTDKRVPPAGRIEVLQRTCRNHLRWEERSVFPLFLEKAQEATGVVEQLKTEHDRIRKQLFRVTDRTDPDTSSILKRIGQLRLLLGLHYYKEELFLVPKLEAMCSKGELERRLHSVESS